MTIFTENSGPRNKASATVCEVLNFLFLQFNLTKQLMVSLEVAGDFVLRNLPQTDNPIFLFASETTAFLVQKQNGSRISGTTLLVESLHNESSDSSFEFPDNMGFDKESEIGVQVKCLSW